MQRLFFFAIVLFVAAAAGGQTLSELLQKGIYTEETLGNTAAAVEIYRQVIAGADAQNDLALQARRRLAAALDRLRPGTPSAVSPRSRQFVAGEPEPRGTVENGRYRHTWSGVEFDVPPGWVASETFDSTDFGEQVLLTNRELNLELQVWMIKKETPAAQVRAFLGGAIAEKIHQRHNGYMIPGGVMKTYQIPPETLVWKSVGGRQALEALAEYQASSQDLSALGPRHPAVLAGRQRMLEYMTWVYTEDSRAFFFARMTPDEFAAHRQHFDRIISSAAVP